MSARSTVLVAAAAALLAIGSSRVASADETKMNMDHNPPSIDRMVETAHSKADHEAIAQRFDEEAERLEQLASTHETLAKRYRSGMGVGPKTNPAGLVNHCETLVKNLRASAREAREMAQMHRQMAHDLAE